MAESVFYINPTYQYSQNMWLFCVQTPVWGWSEWWVTPQYFLSVYWSSAKPSISPHYKTDVFIQTYSKHIDWTRIQWNWTFVSSLKIYLQHISEDVLHNFPVFCMPTRCSSHCMTALHSPPKKHSLHWFQTMWHKVKYSQ